ncbi:hypothetical protein LOK49_LG01G03725 [Camellia lanceoleosa]|uniref:Uncharacterized protein n=1 Tax=Camellia lanceoleosa TaxID=1840588 RepID=A0ACC0IYA3_9ERIC|nr:hypothetical protein LOK49_LG01G03725 [Camellia lanceoleosa]
MFGASVLLLGWRWSTQLAGLTVLWLCFWLGVCCGCVSGLVLFIEVFKNLPWTAGHVCQQSCLERGFDLFCTSLAVLWLCF